MDVFVYPVLAIPVGVALIAGIWIWTFKRARMILDRWAEKNHFQILSFKRRWFRLGPFLWRSSRQQVVYYVEFRSLEGQTIHGWLRCGSYWWGVMQDRAEFIPDESPAPAAN
jgi:hypothetical protein